MLRCRREELKEAVTSSDKAQELLQKYSLEALGESLLAYVTKARAALGPPLLKVRCNFLESYNTIWLLSQTQVLCMSRLPYVAEALLKHT